LEGRIVIRALLNGSIGLVNPAFSLCYGTGRFDNVAVRKCKIHADESREGTTPGFFEAEDPNPLKPLTIRAMSMRLSGRSFSEERGPSPRRFIGISHKPGENAVLERDFSGP